MEEPKLPWTLLNPLENSHLFLIFVFELTSPKCLINLSNVLLSLTDIYHSQSQEFHRDSIQYDQTDWALLWPANLRWTLHWSGSIHVFHFCFAHRCYIPIFRVKQNTQCNESFFARQRPFIIDPEQINILISFKF